MATDPATRWTPLTLPRWYSQGERTVEIVDGTAVWYLSLIHICGENISTIEVEDILYRHPAIMEVAVVARPDEKWGETPCAFVTLKAGAEDTTEEDIIEFCRNQLARFKVPRTVVFGPLPKTSTGKMQKFILRCLLYTSRCV